jgi:hypothetical protein
MPRKFKLVFMEENEEYIADVGCTCNVRMGSGNEDGLLAPAPSETLRRILETNNIRGRLRLGSHALYVDLEPYVRYRIIFPSHLTPG